MSFLSMDRERSYSFLLTYTALSDRRTGMQIQFSSRTFLTVTWHVPLFRLHLFLFRLSLTMDKNLTFLTRALSILR